jgi:predicted ester cyclase
VPPEQGGAGDLLISATCREIADCVYPNSVAERFRFHGPDGFETDYRGLTEYFVSFREAFDDRAIRRGLVVVEGEYVACRTWIEGTFVRPFRASPVGEVPPNGARVVWDLLTIFRFDDRGRLVEEVMRTDNRSLLRRLGVDVARPAPAPVGPGGATAAGPDAGAPAAG